jgi:PiT family inorganic phosphate transporter
VIETGALPKRTAIIMCGVLNFVGAIFIGTTVAMTITKIISADLVSLHLVVSILIGGLIWNLLTWWFKLPISSSHCLIGAIFGAGFAAAGLSSVAWAELDPVFLALLISPAIGFISAALVAFITKIAIESPPAAPHTANLRVLQIASSAFVSLAHGSNDGQKTMGIITLILASQLGYTAKVIPLWVQIATALAIGLGTMIGGERIINTVGKEISHVTLTSVHGFSAEFATASVIMVASHFGFPVSTTHTLSSAVAGATVSLAGVKEINFTTTRKILLAWFLTLPTAALLAAVAFYCLKPFGI